MYCFNNFVNSTTFITGMYGNYNWRVNYFVSCRQVWKIQNREKAWRFRVGVGRFVRMNKCQYAVLIILSALLLLSGCIHFVVPSIMLEAKIMHEMSEVNNKLCQLKKEFCQPWLARNMPFLSIANFVNHTYPQAKYAIWLL